MTNLSGGKSQIFQVSVLTKAPISFPIALTIPCILSEYFCGNFVLVMILIKAPKAEIDRNKKYSLLMNIEKF